MSAAIELAGIELWVGDRRLLGPLDLVVEPGEHLLLVGRSGAGKTSLLRVLAGLESPRAGSVRLFGRAASEGRKQLLRPREREIGMLFQGGALWPHMSVRRTLEFSLRSCGVPKAERAARIAELLASVELVGFDERLPGTLSGGEKQRLALARALAVRPRILLLDEPLGPLDAELRATLLELLARLQREQGFTVVHVTHDPREVESVATRSLRLEGGMIAAEGASA